MLYTREEIIYQLKADITTVKEKGYIPCVATLYGSQNYKIDSINSVLDRKVLVVPTIEDLINNRKLNKEYEDSRGQIKTVDIRTWVNSLIKGSFSDWEVLVTKYSVTDLSCKEFDVIYSMQREIVTINPIKSLKSILRNFNSYVDLTFKELQKGEKSDRLKKSLAHMIQVSEFMIKYFSFIDESGCWSNTVHELFIPLNARFLSKLKEYGCDIEEANRLYNYHRLITNNLYNTILGLWKDKIENKQTKEWLENFKIEFIKKHLRLGELNK